MESENLLKGKVMSHVDTHTSDETVTKKDLEKAIALVLLPTAIKLGVWWLISYAARRNLREMAKTDPYAAEMLRKIETR